MKTVSAAVLVLALTSIAPGCSVYMEVTRPEPVNLNDFQPGMSRDMVFGKIGAPDSSEPEADGDRCDYYRLYTRGYGAGGKVPIALAESAADFFTVGLAEVALTPTEALTRNEKHPVTLCYKNQTLARIGGGVSAGTPLDQNGNSIADTSAAPTAQSAPAPAPAENNNASAAPPIQTAPQVQPVAHVEPATPAEPVVDRSPPASLPVANGNQLELPVTSVTAPPDSSAQQSQHMPATGQ